MRPWSRLAPPLRAGDDVDEGPERCRSAERYSRSAGACEPKDIRAAQRVGGEGSFWLQVLRGQSSPRPKTYDPTPSRVPSSTSRTRAASAYGVNGFRSSETSWVCTPCCTTASSV